MSLQTVLILGAAGRFGQAAVHAFAAAGWRVLAHSRRALPGLPPNASPLALALADNDRLVREAAGASVVVHAINPPYSAWREQALPLLCHGMDVAQRLGATFMLPGNVYNFGAGMPALLAEDADERPTSVKGAIRCDMEAEMRARAEQGLRSLVIRAGDFFGSGQGSWLDQAIVKSLGKGRLVYPGPLDRPHAWAYVPDLARAFVALADNAQGPAFQRLHFAGHTLTGAQLLDAIETEAQMLGLRPVRGFARRGLPWGLIRVGGLVVPAWRELAEMAYLWRVPHALDGAALARRTGPLPSTPLDMAMRRTLIDLGFGARTAAPALTA